MTKPIIEYRAIVETQAASKGLNKSRYSLLLANETLQRKLKLKGGCGRTLTSMTAPIGLETPPTG